MTRWAATTRIFIAAGVLSGCALSRKTPETGSYIQSLRQIKADGGTSRVAVRNYTGFQRLIGQRTAPLHDGEGPTVEEVFAFEADVPNGVGNEGAYMAILRTGGKAGEEAELLYFEQVNHKPRTDRYFHRELTAEERAKFTAFIRDHPVASLRVEKAGTATAPGGKAQVGLTETDTILPNEAEGAENSPVVMFRVTDAHANGALTVEFPTPGAAAHPQVDLVKLMASLRDAGERVDPGDEGAGGDTSPQPGFVCTYVQTIPPTATLLYADPFRKVEKVWAKGGDVRAVISPRGPEAGEAAGGGDRWLALHGSEWVKSSKPPEGAAAKSATEPATRESSASGDVRTAPSPGGAVVPQDVESTGPSGAAASAPPVLTAAPATEPARFSNPNLLPTEEYWTAEPRGTFTAVTHYVPMNEYQSQQVEFWVPTFQFDDEHMSVDAAHGLIYVVSDGALFSLPIPAAALLRR